MTGGNMKFQNLKYDLGKNLVYDSKISDNLRYRSLIRCCNLFFKAACVSHYFERWFETFRTRNYKEERYKKWKIIENKIERKIRNTTQFYGLMPLIVEGMNIAGSQVFEFFEDLDDKFYASYFRRNLYFTCQGTINIEQTVLKTLEKEESLSSERKFKLACKYFLGESVIRIYFSELSNELQMFYKEPQDIKSGIHYSIYFWIWQVFGLRKPINEPIMGVHRRENGEFGIVVVGDSDHAAFQHIFNKAVNDTNEMAIQYLWENFISKMEGKDRILHNVLTILWNYGKNIKFLIYFLLQTTDNSIEIDNFIELVGGDILNKLLLQPRWHNVLVEIFEILHLYFSFRGFRNFFNLIIKSSALSLKTKLYFLEGISEVISNTTKNLLVKNITSFYCSTVEELILAKDLKLLNAFLTIIDKNNYDIFLDEGIRNFHLPIIKVDIDIIDSLLKKMFSRDKIILIKNKIADSRGFIDMCYRILIDKGLNALQEVMEWLLDDRTKIKEKKTYILNYRKGLLIRTLIKYGDLIENKGFLDDVLLWFLESKEFVNDYKQKIIITNIKKSDEFSLIIPYKLLKYFALLLKFNYIDEIMNWSLCDDSLINSLKDRILNDKDIFKNLAKNNNVRVTLTLFTDWCTTKDEKKIKRFKLKVLEERDFLVSLIEAGRYIQAKNLIDWCKCSKAEMKQFKSKFFESVITYFVCNCESEFEFEDFMEWIKIPWITFLKCHFTGLGRNILRVNKNFITYHLYFVKLPFRNINPSLEIV